MRTCSRAHARALLPPSATGRWPCGDHIACVGVSQKVCLHVREWIHVSAVVRVRGRSYSCKRAIVCEHSCAPASVAVRTSVRDVSRV
eukprot:6208961-Pleurochrysis_carterae.AAC.5